MSLPVDIRPASFRGIAFSAREVSREVGRRHAEHSFPQRDEPQVDDIGRKIRRWELQAFVVGDDAGARASKIEAACEQTGAGTLVHPTMGSFEAKCSACRSTRSTTGINTVEFSLMFVEAGTVFEPIPSPGPQATTWADTMRALVNAYYEQIHQVMSVARKVNRAVTASWSERLVALTELGGLIAGEDVDDYVEAIRTAQDAVDSGERAADELASLFEGILDTLTTPSDTSAVARYLGDQVAISWAALDAGADTETDTIILQNAAAADMMQYAQALSFAGSVSARASWTTYDDATMVSTDLSDRLADLGLYGLDADSYAAALDLRAAMVEAIQEAAGTLPRLRDVEIPTPSSALVLAYDLYGDSERAAEIVERNGIGDATSISGTVQVLSS